MKTILKISLIALVGAGIATISTAGIAYAQGNDPHPPQTLLELLDMTREELHEQIQAGATLQEIAENAGVDLDEYRQQQQKQRQDSIQERIQLALENGVITREHASWLQEGLEKGYLGRNGYFMDWDKEGAERQNPGTGFRPLHGRPRGGRQY